MISRPTRWLVALAAFAISIAAHLAGASGVEAAPADDLARLLADSWELTLVEDPLFATNFGDSRFNDRLPREKPTDQQRRLDADRGFVKRLDAIPRDQLSRGEQINYDIFGRLKRDSIAEGEFKAYLMPITNRSGFHVSFPELPRETPLATVRDFENYIARLRAFDQYAADHIRTDARGDQAGHCAAQRGVGGHRQGARGRTFRTIPREACSISRWPSCPRSSVRPIASA